MPRAKRLQSGNAGNGMSEERRIFLRLVAVVAAAAAGLVRTGAGWGKSWNKSAFESKAVVDVLKALGAAGAADSKDITITAPDIAENGAVVPVEITSRIPNTEAISVIAEKNPFPLAATVEIANGSEPYTYVRIKMGETANVRAVVKAGGRYYPAVKEVKVTVGGCG